MEHSEFPLQLWSARDHLGFISIDCGYTATPSYPDGRTGITYVADINFTDAGLPYTVDMNNLQPDLVQHYATVRFFPDDDDGTATRSCYTLRSLSPGGGKYYVRAAFGYGNYDTLNRLPTFDLYLGVNYWTTVRIVNSSTAYIFETIAAVDADYLQVCLVNKGLGNPFISGLELRPLQPNLYHFGTQRYELVPDWTVPDSAGGVVKNPTNDTYDAPSLVMLNAFTPTNSSPAIMELGWSSDRSMDVDAGTDLLLLLYFAELDLGVPAGNASRQFDVHLDGDMIAAAFTPEYMLTTVIAATTQGPGPHSILFVPSSGSMLLPLINAMEIYLVRSRNETATNASDATAIMAIQTKFSVKRNWQGDPCSPAALAWDGLNCTYNPQASPRIIAIYLPSSGLVGEIDASFGQLQLLQHLDLSHNNLSGPIPYFLGHMASLILLDLSSNNLSGSVPNSLLQKSKDGLLTLRIDNNPYVCANSTCNPISNHKESIDLGVVLGSVAAGVVVLAAIICIWRFRAKILQFVRGCHGAQAVEGDQKIQNPQAVENNQGSQPAAAGDIHSNGPQPAVENKDQDPQIQIFTYEKLSAITERFNFRIGSGGFGDVFLGKLEDGTPVAVKIMRSQRSSQTRQGDSELSAEIKHLASSRHRNVVTLFGYCEDEVHLGLVYEYMAGGDLERRLKDKEAAPLSWSQRLKIAVDSARGLHYLHSAFRTPLIHRDVKPTNILLSHNLDAKISDLGLARAISSEGRTHTITGTKAGTDGYIAPEYFADGELRGKTDVYSFGILLLVLVANRQASSLVDNETKGIADWVRETLLVHGGGGASSIVDRRIRGACCDLDSVRKVLELALRCANADVRARPTMTEVVAELERLQREDDEASAAWAAAGTSSRSAKANEY